MLVECSKLRNEFCKQINIDKNDDDALADFLEKNTANRKVVENINAVEQVGWGVKHLVEDVQAVVLSEFQASWMDIKALFQLTYWYDRRFLAEQQSSDRKETKRMVQAKYGRWTAKVSKEKVVYGAVCLKSDVQIHLGCPVFRRPAGIDVTRLRTLRRSAEQSGHRDLKNMVDQIMHDLHPDNCARISLKEFELHNKYDDCWLLIDGRIYDVTSFMDVEEKSKAESTTALLLEAFSEVDDVKEVALVALQGRWEGG